MSRKSATEINPSVSDYGLLHQETEDVKRQAGSKLPDWGSSTAIKVWKKKFYCSGTYKERKEAG